jgi:hypothetical protein
MSLSRLKNITLLFGECLEYAGSEFMLYIPDVQSAYLEVLGMYEMSYM